MRAAIFGALYIVLGKRVWFFPNILAEEATLGELFRFWPKKDEEERPKWTARLFYAAVAVLVILLLRHHAPDEAARARLVFRSENHFSKWNVVCFFKCAVSLLFRKEENENHLFGCLGCFSFFSIFILHITTALGSSLLTFLWTAFSNLKIYLYLIHFCRYQKRVSNIIDDVLEWSPTLALSGMMDKQAPFNASESNDNFTEGSKVGSDNGVPPETAAEQLEDEIIGNIEEDDLHQDRQEDNV